MAGKHLAHISIRFGVDLKEFSTKMQNASRQIAKTGRKMQSVGASITRNLTLPIVAAGGAAAKMAIDFDDSFQKIQNLVGVAGKELNQLRESTLALAGQTAKSPQELADALFFVTSAGQRGAEALSTLELSAKAAAVGLGETASIADAVTSVMNAYGSEVIDAEKATDLLFMTVRQGKTDAESLAPVISRVIPLAVDLGISFEEVSASIATYTRVGASAEEATTGLRGIMSTIKKPTTEAVQALDQMGISVDRLQEIVRTDGLAAALELLIDRSEKTGVEISSVVGNVRALTAILGTAGSQADSYRQILDEMYTSAGAVNEAFKQVSESVGFQFRQSLVDLQAAGIELGAKLFPVVTKLAKFIGGLADKFLSLTDRQQNLLINTVGLVAVSGPLLSIFGRLFFTVSRIIGPIGKFIGGLGYTIDLSRRGAEAIKLTANSMKLLRFATIGVTTAFTVGLAALVAYGIDAARFGDKAKKARKELEKLREETTFLSDQKTGSFDPKNQQKVLEALKASKLTKEQISKLTEKEAQSYLDGLKFAYKGAKTLGIWTEEHTRVSRLLNSHIINLQSIEDETDDITTGIEEQSSVVDGLIKKYKGLLVLLQSGALLEGFDPNNFKVDTEGLASLGDIFTIPDDAFSDAPRSFAMDMADVDEAMKKAYQTGSLIMPIFSSIGESLTDASKGFGDVIKKMISSLLQLASAAIFTQATIKGGLTGGLIAGLAGISLAQGLFSGLLSNVPAFAEGGIVNGPTLAMVGDNRSGKEAIIPLEKMSAIFGNMGGANVNVSVQDVLIDGDKLRIVMDKASNNYNRRR